jgi:hypothetical protein
MKRELRGKKFRSDQEVKTTCSTVPLKLAANGLQQVLEKWVERCKKCIAFQERYFEKETVTAHPQVPTRSNKVSPRSFQTAFVLLFS